IDVQGDSGRRHMEGAPGGCGAPEAAVSRRGVDHDCTLGAMVAEAADGQQRAPCGHGAGIMMTALGLIPRVALLAVVPGACVADALHTLGGHSRPEEHTSE